MKIIQIALDSSEQPYTFGVGNRSNILGLGEDSLVYAWIVSKGEWIPATRTESDLEKEEEIRKKNNELYPDLLF